MTDMVERLARAIQTEAKNGADSPVDFGDASYIARAVLKAMREPTEEMVTNVTFQVVDGDKGIGPATLRALWRAQIDTALGSKQG